MEDRLKEFIDNHRSEIDNLEPPANIWRGINNGLQHRKKQRARRISLVAAAVLLLAVAFTWLLMPTDNNKPQLAANTTPQIQPKTINDVEVYYAALVNTQQKQLSNYCIDYQDVCNDFRNEIDTLNHLYTQLKTEYTTSYNNEAVLNAMIENLQEQVSLLTLQLEIIRNIKKEQKENLL